MENMNKRIAEIGSMIVAVTVALGAPPLKKDGRVLILANCPFS